MKFKIILSFFALLVLKTNLNAQCIPGAVTPAIWGTPSNFVLGFTADADITDTDTLQIVQGMDTTVVLQYLLPKQQAITSPITGTATVTSVSILGVAGMPVGLNWTLDVDATANGNSYNPQTNRYGSVTICGTTFSSPGVKTLTVSAQGCGSLSGITQCQGQSFPLYIEILPGSGGNSAFTISPPVGCNSMDVDFEAIFPSPDPVLFPLDFEWDFGDGTTGTGANINAHNYAAPGTYPVKLDVLINEFYISSVSVVASGGWYPDIEELTSVQSPELYGNVNGISLPEQSSGASKTWTTDIILSSANITGQMFDKDTNTPIFGSADDNLGSGSTTVTPTNNGSFGITTSNFIMTGVIKKRLGSIITVWDTVTVYPSSVATVTSSNGTAFCGNDSTILTVGTGYDFVQWYEDTTLLIGETNASLFVNTAGSYHAVVVSTGNICEGTSNTITIAVDVVSTPVILPTGSGLEISNPNSYDVQWFSNGVPIPGAIGNQLTDLSSGNPFMVTVTNANGCSSSSVMFEACIGGSATAPNGTAVVGGTATTFEAVGFAYNTQTEIGWAVSPVADGMLTSAADVAAINNNNVYIGNGTQLDLLLNCNSMSGPGSYYLTPFLMEATALEEFPFPYSDSTCVPTMGLDISFDCVNTNWEIGNAEVIDPAGNSINLLSLSPIPISFPIGPQLVCGALGGTIPGVSLFGIAPNSNPNGTWNIEVENSGTGVMNITVPAFQISLLAADCSDVTSDMVYDYGPYNLSIAPGATQSIAIKVPPLPTNFPSIANTCSAFGTPVEIQVTNCVNAIEDLVNTANINLYPNPNNGKFTLNLDVLERNDVTISIVDVTGRKVLNRNYASVLGNFTETFDLKNNLNTGFYFMNIEVGSYSTQTKFIIK